jgi:hypothetical protein
MASVSRDRLFYQNFDLLSVVLMCRSNSLRER